MSMLKMVKGTWNWKRKNNLARDSDCQFGNRCCPRDKKRKDDHARFDRNEYKWESRDSQHGCDDRAFAGGLGGDLYSFKDASALVSY